jgi:hypothetical protein
MIVIVQAFALFLVAVAMALPLAHALELPGKRRLEKETYLAMQPVYYPGFTIGGAVGEFGGIVATLVLLVLTPLNSGAFWWVAAALAALLAMHAAYWILTHPVNRFWLRGHALQGAGGHFFAFDPMQRTAPAEAGADGWKLFRDRWEYSHVVRAVLAAVALLALAIGVAVDTTPKL